MRTKNPITIKEYDSFVCDRKIDGYETLPEPTFSQLENFILTNKTKDTDALELLGLSAKKGIGKVITAKNYVGVISMNDGTTIEILHKIYSTEEDYSKTKVKRLLIEMLKTLRNFPYKTLHTSTLNIEKMTIFEIFIRMFLDEIFLIVKRGLQCNYETIHCNERVYKGKMIFAQHIKENSAHKERCFVEFDEFNSNRAENKLIKTTLLYLFHQSTSVKNRSDIKTLLNSFNDVGVSDDYMGDFLKLVPDRNMKDYNTALLWCKVFLQGKSFTSFYGSEVAYALLFPMETLFESYVAAKIKQELSIEKYSVSAQDSSYALFDLPNRKFLLRPDIVVKRKTDKAIFILDTKWKVLSDMKSNYGISQADMYQMYAYQKKYNAQNIALLYPATEKLSTGKKIEFQSGDGVNVMVKFIDLFDVKKSITNIVSCFKD